MCYCHVLLCYKWWVIAATMTFYFTTEIISLCIYFAVYRWNRTRLMSFGINSATHSLSERFQIANTIRATEILLPLVILHGICGSSLQLASYYPRTRYVVDGPTHRVIYSVLLVTSFALIYSVLHPYLTIWKSDNLQRALRRLFDRALQRIACFRRFQAANNGTISSSRLVNSSQIPLALSPIEENVAVVAPAAPGPAGRVREMSLLSSGSDAISGTFRELSSGGMMSERESTTQRHLNPELGKSKRMRRKKSPMALEAGTRNFKMTPEQHCELLQKYWD